MIYDSFSQDIETLLIIFGCFMFVMSFIGVAELITWIDYFIERHKKNKVKHE